MFITILCPLQYQHINQGENHRYEISRLCFDVQLVVCYESACYISLQMCWQAIETHIIFQEQCWIACIVF